MTQCIINESGIFVNAARILCGSFFVFSISMFNDDAAGLLDRHDPDNRVGVAWMPARE